MRAGAAAASELVAAAILRGTDNGLSFTLVAPDTIDGYYAVIGDGTRLYTQIANTGNAASGLHSYIELE
jgi:hypothetical protein